MTSDPGRFLDLCCHWMTFRGLSLSQFLDCLSETRVAAIELPILHPGARGAPLYPDAPTTEWSRDAIRQFRQVLDRRGVRVACCQILSGNPLDDDALALVRRKIPLAAELGASVVTAEAGAAEGPHERERLYRRLRSLAEEAAAHGCLFCLETLPGLCGDHYGMRQTLDACQSPALKLSFDLGNITYFNASINPEIALAKTCHLVGHVRLRDSQGEFGETWFPALGYGGAVDFVRVLELLRPCGFRGPYSIAIEGVANEGLLPADSLLQRFRDSLRTLEFCGYFDATAENR